MALLAVSPPTAPADAACPPIEGEIRPGLGAYLRLASRYRAGELAALRELRDWRLAEVERAIDQLRSSAGRLVDEPCPGAIELRLVEAAILMHAHAAFLALGDQNASEGEAQLAAATGLLDWSHAAARSRSLHPLLEPAAVYAGLAASCLGFWTLEPAEALAQHGLKGSPRDPDLLHVAGCAKEALALTSSVRHRASEAREQRAAAERLFRDVLAVRPDRQDARLRLGGLLLQRGELVEARSLLELVASRAKDRRQIYLATLFLGRLHEERHARADAIVAYTRAIALQPDSQAARIGLAWVLEQDGGAQPARPLVLASLAASRRLTPRSDPWWTYPYGPYDFGGEVLERLRRRVLTSTTP